MKIVLKKEVYEPNKHLKLGIKIWGEMFRELFDFRELIWRLFVRDLSARYKQSMLGNIWSVLMPFVAIGTFMYLSRAGIIHIQQTHMPYPLYALIGLTVWQIFATGLSCGANSLIGAGDLISKINFPREVSGAGPQAWPDSRMFLEQPRPCFTLNGAVAAPAA